MIERKALRLVLALALSAGIALVSLLSARLVSLPVGGFVPGSFVTHTVMLALSLAAMRGIPHGRLSGFGLTIGAYRFRPTILLWVLPTAMLSTLAILGSGGSEVPEAIGGRTVLQRVIFIWFYASVCEEVLTRGLLQTLLFRNRRETARRRRLSMPVVVSGLFFGAMHLVLIDSMGATAIPMIVMATLLGFLAGHYREATGSLIPAIVVHALFNVGGMLPGWIFQWLGG